jgi:charged multivesicular body protein 1
MKTVTKSMSGVVKGMDVAMKNMDVEKISQIMDDFERQFEDMDVRSGYMENAMSNSTASATPAEEVDNLIQMVADENGLEVGGMMDDVGAVGVGVPQKAAPEAAPRVAEGPIGADNSDSLEARLAALRK